MKEKQFIESLSEHYIEREKDNAFINFCKKATANRYRNYIKGGRLLELGCSADGYSTSELAVIADEVVCVEGVEQFIEQAKITTKAHSNIKFVSSMFEEMEFENEFDYVVADFILEHVENVAQILKVCHTALKRDGLLLSTVPNADAFSRQLAVAMGLMNNVYELTANDIGFGHRRVFDKEKFEAVIKESEFEIIQSGGNFVKPFADFQMEKITDAGIIGEAQFEGLIKLGEVFPELCHGIYVVARKQ